MDPSKRAFTTGEVAELCSVTAPTVIRWIKEGRLAAFRVSEKGGRRIPRQCLIDFAHKHSIALGPHFETGQRKILVVGHDSQSIELLRGLLLARDGFETQVAYTAFEAGILAIKLKPHAVFLDLGVAGIDLKLLCRRMRTEPDLSHGKILVVSPVETPADVEGMFAAGADAYLAMPLRADAVMTKLREVLGPPPTPPHARI